MAQLFARFDPAQLRAGLSDPNNLIRRDHSRWRFGPTNEESYSAWRGDQYFSTGGQRILEVSVVAPGQNATERIA
jgi:hypothetical protein